MVRSIATPDPEMSELHDSRRAVVASPWDAAGMICWREIVRFLRQRNRVIGAVGQPILFWLLFGAGMHSTFQIPNQSFGTYFFPGTLLLILLFTAIFATISVIEDRNAGFLQGVLVAPIPRWSMILGKVLGGTLLALLQGGLFLALGAFLGIRYSLSSAVGIVGLSFLISWSFTSLGLMLAWRMESTQGFHAIMNLFLMPMWLLSGAFFPVPLAGGSISQTLMHVVMRLNPATYGLAGIRQLMQGGPVASLWQPSLTICWIVTALFAVLLFSLTTYIARQPSTHDAR
ncbi:MAG: ABC transporter permease [Planctomycetota bacterium]|nr:ABC transporter permease [Planctomycetota bacterium]MDA1179740.1 ABC transporter permease [Planctomycetota bacterium]